MLFLTRSRGAAENDAYDCAHDLSPEALVHEARRV